MKEDTVRMSLYIPQSKLEYQIVERLAALAEKKDRSINYVTVEAIMQFLDREDKKS